MFKSNQYTYFLRKKEGLIVLGKVQGPKCFSAEDLFPFFMGHKRLAWREIRKFLLEGRGVLVAQDELGRRFPLGIPSCLFGLQREEKISGHFIRRIKHWVLRLSHKEIVF